ncbi:MAG: ABC transporter substrate-binding protein, partial [Lapillicoccus sp.]
MDNGAKLAVEAVNAAGGIAAMGGAKLELLSADSKGAPEVGQSEAQRLIQEGAVAIVGTYQSAV